MRRTDPPTPRPDWQRRVEHLGLLFHTADGRPYWDESACYVFSKYTASTSSSGPPTPCGTCAWSWCSTSSTASLFPLFLIPEAFEELIVRSWDEDWPSVYGRFDLAYDGVDTPKLLEFNADTPTALVEASVAQWHWLKETDRPARRPVQQHPRPAGGGVAGGEGAGTGRHARSTSPPSRATSRTTSPPSTCGTRRSRRTSRRTTWTWRSDRLGQPRREGVRGPRRHAHPRAASSSTRGSGW